MRMEKRLEMMNGCEKCRRGRSVGIFLGRGEKGRAR